ncbi:MAG: Mth938-like domain-containing protein [Gammaproteobacteria bacterium]
MDQSRRSPAITHLSWGRIEMDGYAPFKDAKVYPGGAREWDWRETGTHHVPGIQSADVQELVDNGAEVIVLSEGILNYLRVCPETLRLLEQKGITTYVLQTEKAVSLYNRLCKKERVGGLFHCTC